MSAAAVRRRRPALAADIRGIALQTVIIIVVLLVIAGGVAGVLLTRGGEAIGELEAQGLPGNISTAADCTALGGTPGMDQDEAGTGTYCLIGNGVASACRLYRDKDGDPGAPSTASSPTKCALEHA